MAPEQKPAPPRPTNSGLDFGPHGEPIPIPTPIATPFFDAARRGQLVLQRCPRDGFFFYPRNRCPRCFGTDWSWEQASGLATIVSYTIDRTAMVPGFRAEAPYVVAILQLAEGPRMPGRITGCDPSEVKVGAKVRAKPVQRGNTFIFEFALAPP
ncbi:MAG: Zn-ribbon domain-containing OB-fold protein [Candidatus Binataceae bacterium]